MSCNKPLFADSASVSDITETDWASGFSGCGGRGMQFTPENINGVLQDLSKCLANIENVRAALIESRDVQKIRSNTLLRDVTPHTWDFSNDDNRVGIPMTYETGDLAYTLIPKYSDAYNLRCRIQVNVSGGTIHKLQLGFGYHLIGDDSDKFNWTAEFSRDVSITDKEIFAFDSQKNLSTSNAYFASIQYEADPGTTVQINFAEFTIERAG